MLAGQRRIQPFLHQLLTGAGYGVDAGVQRRSNPTIAPCLAGRRGVGLQQDACLQQLTGGGFALLDQHIEPITLLGAKLDDVFLDGRLLRGHDTSPEWPERSIQGAAAESTTEGTSTSCVDGRLGSRASTRKLTSGSTAVMCP